MLYGHWHLQEGVPQPVLPGTTHTQSLSLSLSLLDLMNSLTYILGHPETNIEGVGKEGVGIYRASFLDNSLLSLSATLNLSLQPFPLGTMLYEA